MEDIFELYRKIEMFEKRLKALETFELSGGSNPCVAGGDEYGSFEKCTANLTWQDFTNISVVIVTTATCNIEVIGTCWLSSSTSNRRYGMMRVVHHGVTYPGTYGRTVVDMDTYCYGCLAHTYTFMGVAAGTLTFKMQRYTEAEYASLVFYLPSLSVNAVPVVS